MSTRRYPHPLHPRYWPIWLALVPLWLIAHAPYRLRRLAAGVLGILLRWFTPSRRRIVATNLALCFPELDDDARARLLRDNFRASAEGLFDTAIAWWVPTERVRRMLEVRGMQRLVDARSSGRGVLLLGVHMGTLEMAGRALAIDADSDVVYRRQKNPAWDRIIHRNRERWIRNVIERSDVRAMRASLLAGHVLWYLPDQDNGAKHSVFAPFFGIPAATLTATARLARVGRAAVIPVAHWREDDGRWVVEIGEPLEDFPGRDPVADATRVNALIETLVRAHPEQYLWAHRRFKTRPPGAAPLYPRRN
ncbi:MAG: LpxL/LpxP family Kdo(2)-lipid IV(A) lauroyl/palmitoleoyl acyltransferase [Pseudomonadales bacterium]|jgi:KDO2-lipid IV(A) lauroyltransferase|nr:LpxL/LpxP family Kdo(2)-lipid IV(A) lauroyl/palmitoleoyl acyltransferase [Pseudomonadales bacterium]MCP5321326.1 LpxL/LpxP family Kdo(2)-lipid IV(A) lauroyl/palmitoleoyl acyltransferase [Pseudomonadales bacterium]MCP5336240.1 LpxL/LpxP family Kdo(2)-lipid IV(A) lauroyl/palmitoleoyl acyltransferase [Pseudomonadales bacterium]